MRRPLKVFSGTIHVHGLPWRQVQAVIACTSQSAAATTAGVPISFIRDYWSETGNQAARDAALARPGILLIAPLSGVKKAGDFVTPDEMKERLRDK